MRKPKQRVVILQILFVSFRLALLIFITEKVVERKYYSCILKIFIRHRICGSTIDSKELPSQNHRMIFGLTSINDII